MDRRSFLSSMVGGVAITAAVRTWPFRVYSFSSEIVRPETEYEWQVKLLRWDNFVSLYPQTAANMRTFNGFKVTRTEDFAVIHWNFKRLRAPID